MVLLIEKQADIPHVYCIQSKQPALLLLSALQERICDFGGGLLVIKFVPVEHNSLGSVWEKVNAPLQIAVQDIRGHNTLEAQEASKQLAHKSADGIEGCCNSWKLNMELFVV